MEEEEGKPGLYKATYQPRRNQHKQTVMVNFGGVAVPGSPFRVQNDNPNDPSLVKVRKLIINYLQGDNSGQKQPYVDW